MDNILEILVEFVSMLYVEGIVGWKEVWINLFDGWRGAMHQNVKKTKEETVDGDYLCFLEAMNSVVCMLQGYGGSIIGGAKLGGLICDSY